MINGVLADKLETAVAIPFVDPDDPLGSGMPRWLRCRFSIST